MAQENVENTLIYTYHQSQIELMNKEIHNLNILQAKCTLENASQVLKLYKKMEREQAAIGAAKSSDEVEEIRIKISTLKNKSSKLSTYARHVNNDIKLQIRLKKDRLKFLEEFQAAVADVNKW